MKKSTSTVANLLQPMSNLLINRILKKSMKNRRAYQDHCCLHKLKDEEKKRSNLVEDPGGVCVGAAEEFIKGGGIIDFSVVDEVLSRVLGVVWPRLRRQPPHQPQHSAVRARSSLHVSTPHAA